MHCLLLFFHTAVYVASHIPFPPKLPFHALFLSVTHFTLPLSSVHPPSLRLHPHSMRLSTFTPMFLSTPFLSSLCLPNPLRAVTTPHDGLSCIYLTTTINHWGPDLPALMPFCRATSHIPQPLFHVRSSTPFLPRPHFIPHTLLLVLYTLLFRKDYSSCENWWIHKWFNSREIHKRLLLSHRKS